MDLSRKSPLRFRFYVDVAGEWRWRLKSGNGRIVADSGEGYQRHANAVRAARLLVALIPGARL